VQMDLRLQEVIIFILVAGTLTLKGWRTNQLILQQAKLAEERANLSRYFAPTVVDLLAGGARDLRQARTHEIAVMFVDLVGFSRYAETRPDAEVVAYLRRYYATIEKAVFDNSGTLDKYLGDGVMATFGTPTPGPQDALNALRAARAIIAAIDAMAADDGSGEAPPLRVSVGLHFGRVTIGDVGPDRRLEFAVIGDTVNVASRLESATREVGCRILCSDDLMQQVDDDPAARDFVPHRGMMLRGRASPIDGWSYGASPTQPT
jgi:adenylate cyclase